MLTYLIMHITGPTQHRSLAHHKVLEHRSKAEQSRAEQSRAEQSRACQTQPDINPPKPDPTQHSTTPAPADIDTPHHSATWHHAARRLIIHTEPQTSISIDFQIVIIHDLPDDHSSHSGKLQACNLVFPVFLHPAAARRLRSGRAESKCLSAVPPCVCPARVDLGDRLVLAWRVAATLSVMRLSRCCRQQLCSCRQC